MLIKRVINNLLLASLFLPTFLVGLAPYENRATISLLEEVAVTAPDVKLGEIAVIDSQDESFKEYLKSLVVDPVPPLGVKKSISSYRIKQVLQANEVEGVAVKGIQSGIYTLSKTIEREELEQMIQHWVEDQLPTDVEAEVYFNRLPFSWKVPMGSETDLVINAKGKEPKGTVSLVLESRVDDKILSQANARIVVKHFKEALVLERPLAKGEEVDIGNVVKRRAEITDINGLELIDRERVKNRLAKRNLPIGHVLTVDDLEEPVLVEAGSINRIIVKNGKISMNIAGARALQSGRKGDYVLFSNPLNRKENLLGEVIGKGIARIELR